MAFCAPRRWYTCSEMWGR